MSVRTVLLASVCSAFLAASAAVPGSAAASQDAKLVSQAYKALQVGDAAAAVNAYTKAIESRKLEPEMLANALLNRGLAFQRLNEHAHAVDDYTAAMRIDAMSGKLRALALYNRGLSQQRLNQSARAIEDYTSALFLDSQFSHAYYSRGTLLREGGQHLFALADFDKAIRFKYPEPARVHFAEAVTYEKLRRTEEARAALNKALAANPDYEPAKQRLALLDGKQVPLLQVASADQIATSAVSQAPTSLPAAQAPSATLMVDTAEAAETKVMETSLPAKKIADRVPAEQAPVKVAAADPATEETERIIAVEEVPADAPEQAPAADVASTAAEPENTEQAVPAEKISGWSVQLASAASENAAWTTWKNIKARHKALASKEPVVVRADLGKKGIFYRVRLVGFEKQTDANNECARLKSKGVRCFISKAAS